LSLIRAADQGLAPAVAVRDVPADLLAALRAVTDPCCRRGVRHQFVSVLGVAVCAMLAGAKSYIAIAEWAHDLPKTVRQRLGIERIPPSETAIRRAVQAIDADLLDQTVNGWLAARAQRPERWRAIAVDGKWRTETVYAITDLDQTRIRPRRSPTSCAATGSWRTHCTGSGT